MMWMNDWILVIVGKVQRYQMLFQPTSKPADSKAELRFKVVSNQKWDKISSEIVNFMHLYVDLRSIFNVAFYLQTM